MSDNTQTLADLIPHLRAISKASGMWVFAEDYSYADQGVYVEMIYRRRYGEEKMISRKIGQGRLPYALCLGGIVMAYRGAENDVADVCRAMREKNELWARVDAGERVTLPNGVTLYKPVGYEQP